MNHPPTEPARNRAGIEPGGERGRAATAAPAERRLARRAGSMSMGVVVSRITGLIREQVLAYLFPTRLLDAFFAAYTFPNALRDLLGEGALSKAFVATFAGVDETRGPEDAHRLFARVLAAVLPVALLISVLGVIFAPVIVDFIFSRGAFGEPFADGLRFGFDTPRDLTVWLTRVMFPFIGLASVASLFTGGLQARKSFFLPALASAFFNVVTVVFAVVGYAAAPALGLHPMAGLAIGVPLGGVAQLLPQLFWLRRTGYRRAPTGGVSATLRDSAFRRVCRIFVPAALAAGTNQIHVFISRYFASGGASWIAWFSMAFRLAQLPAGLIIAGLSSAALPSLTRRAGPDGGKEFDAMLAHSGRLMATLTLPAAAGLIGVAGPVVALIYQRGAFRPQDTLEVTAMLSLFVLGLPAFGANKLLTDAFFAQGTTRAPLVVAGVSAVVTWFTTEALVVTAGLGHLGLPLATVSVGWLSAGLLSLFLVRRLGVDGRGRGRARAVFASVAAAAARSLLPAVATGAASWFASGWVLGRFGGGDLGNLAACLVGVAAGSLTWLGLVRVIAPREWAPVRDVFVHLRRRLGR